MINNYSKKFRDLFSRWMSAPNRTGKVDPQSPKGDPQSGEFPAELDPVWYRETYPDLRRLSIEALNQHWAVHGSKEGRCGNQIRCREDFIALIPKTRKTLEIGPFNRPLTRGPNVKYFDVLDEEGLIVRAQSFGFETADIPTIDFVSSEADLGIIHEKFSFILSSHVLEHQPNMIKHLSDVQKLLEPGGYYFLLIPDKRYCFDHFIPESNLAQVIEAWVTGNTRHCLRSVIEHRALTTHNESLRHWQGDHGEAYLSVKERCEIAFADYKNSEGRYIDVHAWYFTPESFRQMILCLTRISFIGLELSRVYTTRYGDIEFWAILRNPT
jgi:SAM-dependent methyltransferase